MIWYRYVTNYVVCINFFKKLGVKMFLLTCYYLISTSWSVLYTHGIEIETILCTDYVVCMYEVWNMKKTCGAGVDCRLL